MRCTGASPAVGAVRPALGTSAAHDPLAVAAGGRLDSRHGAVVGGRAEGAALRASALGM